jgi:hypothetical protein
MMISLPDLLYFTNMSLHKNQQATPCRGCGKPVLFASTTEGRSIPLDLVAPVYAMIDSSNGRIRARRSTAHLVSHFATCPMVGRFNPLRRSA